MLEFLRAGMYTSIQDRGRYGLAYYSIPQSGAMDLGALEMANMLAGNPKHAACFEFTLQGAKIRFHEETMIGLTGADMQWTLNGEEAGRFQSIHVQAGDILQGAYSIEGVRAYLAVQGRLDCPLHHGSYSFYTYGKTTPARIQQGDSIAIIRDRPLSHNYVNLMILLDHDAKEIKFTRGPEWDILTEDAKQSMQDSAFKISAQSNRMGARLEGNTLGWRPNTQTKTAPLVPGMIQLPPSGNPIVILQDGQTTGGYPRIGYIHTEELWKFNQIRYGREFRLILS